MNHSIPDSPASTNFTNDSSFKMKKKVHIDKKLTVVYIESFKDFNKITTENLDRKDLKNKNVKCQCKIY